jgi:multidrug resistance efflux pump
MDKPLLNMEEYEKIELRHEDVQEILGTPPSWIVRWGTTVILLSVCMLFWVSWMVKYPDIIPAQIVMTTETPPVPVVARSTGYLQRLIAVNDEVVKQGDLLVVMQNTANHEDVLKLEENLAEMEALTPSVFLAFEPSINLNLGEIQPIYSNFVQILKELQFKKEENFSEQTVSQYADQSKNIDKLIKTENDKLYITEKNLTLARQRFAEKRQLYTQGVASRNELEDLKKEEYNYEQLLKNGKSRIEELQGQKLQIRKNILDVQQTTKETSTTKYVGLVEALNQLKSSISKWKQTYLLTAPIAGKVSFFNNYWSENQNIKEGAEVMAIVPPSGSNIVGIVELPLEGSGKVLEGQRVLIKFYAYPYQRFGAIEGTIAQKSLLPRNDKTLSVRVNLPNGLTTTYGNVIKFDQQMLGTAEIITEERRFIERLFDKLISVFRNR